MRLLTIVFLAAAPLAAGEPADPVKDFLAKIEDANVDVRYAARLSAPQLGPAAVVPLGERIVHARREVAITSRAALELLVHHAGRPGAWVERAPVAAELAKLLDSGRPAAVKREALYLIACVGDDAIVPAAAALLADADGTVAEAARQSLERIPGKAALSALLEGARKASPALRIELIYSASKKGDRSASSAIADFIQKDDVATRLAVLEALARLGAAESVPLFEAEYNRADAAAKPRIADEALRLADNLKADDPGLAREIYQAVLAEAPVDYQREHALGALCPEGSLDAIPRLAAALADASPRLRRLAANRLAALQGPALLGALEKAYGEAGPSDRPAILRVLADRDPAGTKALVEKAAGDPAPELKIVALDILGRLDDPALEDVCRRAAETGPDWLKPTALKGTIAIGRKKLAAGAKAEALPLFVRALDLARDAGQRLEALKGVIEVGNPKEIGRLESLLADPALGADAARGFVAFAALLGKGGDKAAAEKHLLKVATGDFPRDLKAKAGEELRGLGIDPKSGVKAQGFVVDWWVVTPIADTDGKAMESKLFPETEIRLDDVQKVEARRYRWQKFDQIVLDGVIDLVPLFRRSTNCVTYAYTEVESPKEQDVLFKVGSDDGCALFVNDARILFKPGPRSWSLDTDSVKGRLAAGKNKLLLKVQQGDGDWMFSLRVTDLEGKPLPLKAVVK